MRGAIPLESVYGRRLDAVRPTKTEIDQLGKEYIAHLAPYARDSIALMQAHGVGITLVSGGLREAIVPLAAELALKESVVHAVPVFFDERGDYLGFDEQSPLARQKGKLETVAALNLRKPIVAVGDGMTDTEIRGCADSFAAYTGFVRREAVIARADFIFEDFRQLSDAVLG
jgi:phosphoserine phosphatase